MAESFKRWDDLQRLRLNDGRPRKLEKEVVEEAKLFVSEYEFYRDGSGLWLCRTPYGTYIWWFVVMMKQERIWNYPEFQKGHQFGLNPEEPYRDANPYEEPARSSSWDCGYILGLYDAKKNK